MGVDAEIQSQTLGRKEPKLEISRGSFLLKLGECRRRRRKIGVDTWIRNTRRTWPIKINYVGLIVITDTEATITELACMCARSLHISYGCSAWDF